MFLLSSCLPGYIDVGGYVFHQGLIGSYTAIREVHQVVEGIRSEILIRIRSYRCRLSPGSTDFGKVDERQRLLKEVLFGDDVTQ